MAAPTVVVDVHQSANALPYSLVTMAVAISKNYCIETSSPATFKWTASSSGTNEYYLELAAGGDPSSALTSGTITTARAMMTDATVNKYMHMKPGTLGSLAVYECAWGDNDSLGFDTLYVRIGDSGATDNDPARAPLNQEVVIVWDEGSTGDAYGWQDCTVEWWADLTDSATATALSGYGEDAFTAQFAAMIDPRDDTTEIPLIGSVPTDTQGSPVKGPMLQIPLPAGTYSWKCRVTNASREQTTVDVTFTVNADSRTVATVNSAGGADYTSIAAALTAGETLIEVEGGHTETISVTTNTAADQLIYWTGTGTKPKVSRDTNSRFQMFGDGFGMVGIDMAAESAITRAAFDFMGTGSGCRNSFVANCDVVSGAGIFTTGYEWSSTSSTQASVVQMCAAINCEMQTAVTAYGVQTENDDHACYACGLYGCLIGPSTNESAFRTTGTVTMCVAMYTRFEEDSKDSVRQSYGEGFFWYGCETDGSNRIGETGNNFHKARRARWDSCLLARTATTSGLPSLGFQAGTEDYTVVNCIIKDEAGEKGMAGSSNLNAISDPFPGYQNNDNIRVHHNTFWMTVDSTTAFDAGGETDETYSSGCEAKGNVAAVQSSYTAFENTPLSAWDLADNDTIVGDLDSNYQIDDTSTVTTEPGAYYDYNGYIRGTTSLAGASIDAPAELRSPNSSLERSRDRSRER